MLKSTGKHAFLALKTAHIYACYFKLTFTLQNYVRLKLLILYKRIFQKTCKRLVII